MDEMVVLNELDCGGMRTVHVMRQGRPVEREHWLETVTAPGLDSLWVRVDDEKALGVHHLWMFWMAREVVRCAKLDGVGMMWWMDRQPVRTALTRAAEWLWGETGLDGNVGLIQKAPAAAPRGPDGKMLPVKLTILGEERELALREASWVPRDFVVVTREEESDGRSKNQ
jgi:hypothetical protein